MIYFSDRNETIREAYLLDVAVPKSHNLHRAITEKPQQYTDLRVRDYKNMTTGNGLYNTASFLHDG